MLNHLVFGAGLIGCYLGANLQYNKQRVTLICREHIADKLSKGIVLTDYLQHRIAVEPIPSLTSVVDAMDSFDVIWLTVKCTAVETALAQLRLIVGSKTTLVCCQNGLGSEQLVKQAFPDNQVLRAMVPFNVVELADGHFHRGSQGTFAIEDNPANFNFVTDLVSHIESPVLEASICNDMDSLLWAKLQLNLGNSINALADIPVKAMLQQRKYRQVIAQMMRELLLVTDAKSIELPKVTSISAHYLPVILNLPDWLFKIVANRMLAIDENVRTSMWWDISQAKPTEIDYLNGAIVEQAKLLGISTPVNQKVIELIYQLSNNKLQNKRKITGKQLYNLVMPKI
ncbi:2-dehydropantoate 2-reductase [Aliiglaciecola lipolytica]|uniref:2-dehydropantoate 2-reductase n=1 Tax=Aliiglaciecola lipolytica E3 TaxID=1127673 RepID=K6YC21_9ALTE|nr:2-dehydropantoate 2-reductase [Aliiglaciecola lipolytica]GAC14193.1 2-dehydropantoate 2-reductase [Aliiglaciecola lipolytica E3]